MVLLVHFLAAAAAELCLYSDTSPGWSPRWRRGSFKSPAHKAEKRVCLDSGLNSPVMDLMTLITKSSHWLGDVGGPSSVLL